MYQTLNCDIDTIIEEMNLIKKTVWKNRWYSCILWIPIICA